MGQLNKMAIGIGIGAVLSVAIISGFGWTPDDKLRQAATADDLAGLKAALAEKAAVNSEGEDGETALIAASGSCHPDAVSALIAAGANVNLKAKHYDSVLGSGRTALLAAAGSERAECAQVVRVLVAAGADANLQDDTGETPLLAASVACNPDTVRALIDNGADVNEKANGLGIAGKEGGYMEPPLVAASGSDGETCPDVVKTLLVGGADLNATNFGGLTALDNAASEGRLAAAQELVNAGADVNASTAGGVRAISLASGDSPVGASAAGRVAIVRLLQEHGAHA
jgi:ankyrin repeat protein